MSQQISPFLLRWRETITVVETLCARDHQCDEGDTAQYSHVSLQDLSWFHDHWAQWPKNNQVLLQDELLDTGSCYPPAVSWCCWCCCWCYVVLVLLIVLVMVCIFMLLSADVLVDACVVVVVEVVVVFCGGGS